ncbi:MAG TPA: cytidylate kinase-like family protein [Myxococcota bacterium]|nr:cytidylate kinase-like family protein [Myxococcota bacterium]
MSREVEALIERQIRRWELLRRAPKPGGRCVAVSRMPGAGGRELARRLAERLDYGLFDRELVEAVAAHAGVQTRLVEGLDERVRSAIERVVADAFRTGTFAESDYLREVVRTIRTVAERGNAVILGRGSAQLLSPQQALRVRVVAPRPVRIERRAKARGIAADEAARQIDGEDAERREFVRHQFRLDPEDACLYDLVLNTGTLAMETAVELAAEALHRQFPVVEAR